jgi:hypothetical protein
MVFLISQAEALRNVRQERSNSPTAIPGEEAITNGITGCNEGKLYKITTENTDTVVADKVATEI